MKKLFSLVASLFSALALMEIGTASVFAFYQPELPKEE